MSEEKRLAEIRTSIDSIDEQIQQLISQRARYAQEVAIVKADQGDPIFYRPKR